MDNVYGHPLPAHYTKHLPLLQYPFRASCFHLAQLDNGTTNGTALWLGAQCLSLYLAEILKNNKPLAHASGSKRHLRAIELGSGIGLSALALSSMGWDVVATDLPDVVSAVLSGNVARNLSQLPPDSGTIQVRILDWTVPPDQWSWDGGESIASVSNSHAVQIRGDAEYLGPPFDLIISSDTLYVPDIVQPLLRTLHALSMQSVLVSSPPSRLPVIYICLERRDPTLIDYALSEAKNWDFNVVRVSHKKVTKAMEKGGAKWDKKDWEGVEIWRMTLNMNKNLSILALENTSPSTG